MINIIQWQDEAVNNFNNHFSSSVSVKNRTTFDFNLAFIVFIDKLII